MQKKKPLTAKDSLGRKRTIKQTPKRSVHDKRNGTRPNGIDLTRYEGYEKWTGHRWAWEFLRRNDDFRADCTKLREDAPDVSEDSIAEKYGLYSYKDYRDSYKTSPKPRFRTNSLRIIGESSLGHHETRYLENVKLRKGQVAVVIDLEFAVTSGGSIQRQIVEAQSKLVELAKLYHGVEKLPNTSRKTSLKFLTYLCVLDLFWGQDKNKLTPEDIHNYLIKVPDSSMTGGYDGKYIYDMHELAKNCTKDYLYIASSTPKIEENLERKRLQAERYNNPA